MDELDLARRDYDEHAQAYDEFIRDHPDTDPLSRAFIDAFGELVQATGGDACALDAGCGPGHWTDRLDTAGLRTRGVDLSPAMIAIARARCPDLQFDVGSVLELDLADDSVSGVLAHFSLIHLPPALVPTALAQFHRVLRPGGHLLLATQSGDDFDGWVSYDHAVSPAYRWTVGALADVLRAAGFTETARAVVRAPGPRARVPGAYVFARAAGWGRTVTDVAS